jgi:hypothetical protein
MRGSLKKCGKRWKTVIDVGINSLTGRRKQQKKLHKTEAAAEAHLATMLKQVQSGEYVPPTKMRLAS